jgi:hypothetical protein
VPQKYSPTKQRTLHVIYNTYYRCYCTYPDKNKLYILGDGIEEIVPAEGVVKVFLAFEFPKPHLGRRTRRIRRFEMNCQAIMRNAGQTEDYEQEFAYFIHVTRVDANMRRPESRRTSAFYDF